MQIVSATARLAKRFLARRCAVVLTYHSVQSTAPEFAVWHHLDAERFEEHIAFIASSFNCVQVSQLVACAERGEMPANSVAITFDDGFVNNLRTALPILERFGVPATVLLAAGYIDRDCVLWPEYIAIVLSATPLREFTVRGERVAAESPSAKAASYKMLTRACKQLPAAEHDSFLAELAREAGLSDSAVRAHPLWEQFRIMSWSEVKTLASSPLIEIGAHTLTHPVLSRIADEQARQEIAGSKALIEKHVGAVKLFAYPYGGDHDYSERHVQMAREAGYKGALSSMPGTLFSGSSSFEIPRYGVGDSCTLSDLRFQLNGGLAFATGGARWF